MQGSHSSSTSQQYLLDKKIEGDLPKTKKLTLLPLIFLIYFEIGGGPFGEENAVRGVGPLLAILGFIIFPFFYCFPVALITAELATAFPDNGGFVIWVNEAFGPFWASLMGFWKFFSAVVTLASFPGLCVDYLKSLIPALSHGLPRYLFLFLFSTVLPLLNYSGLRIVGYATIGIGAITLIPFVLMTLLAIPKIDPKRWLSLGQKGVKKDWALWLNNVIWNMGYWDNFSTFIGETEEPQKTFPKALFIAGSLACLLYMVPLLPAVGVMQLEQREWVDGYFAVVVQVIAGKWLKICLEIGAVFGAIGAFEGQLSSVVYQLMGMADLGFLPRIFAERSRWFDTPWFGILVSALIALATSYLSFVKIVAIANFLYYLGLVLEIASFLKIRKKFPTLERPFKVPLRFPGSVIMCSMPLVPLAFVIATASKLVYAASAFMTAVGIGFYYFMNLSKSKKWIEFNTEGIDDEP